MSLRPFPYQLSIGTDIVHVNRVRAILQKDQANPGYLARFLRRFLTSSERIEFHKIRDSLTEDQLDASSKHLAGRWAAKEAVIKAVSWRRLGFHDIRIQRFRDGSGVFAVILDKVSKERQALKQNTTTSLQRQATRKENDGKITDRAKARLPLLPGGQVEVATDDPHEQARLAEENSADHSTQDLDGNGVWTSDDGDVKETAGQIAKISISHDGEYATAVCLAAEEPMDGDVGGEATAREPF